MNISHLIVGLGNPGRRYADHRHNVGFMVLDELARRRNLAFVAGDEWRTAADPEAGLLLLQPLTFMNRSGEPLARWARTAGVELVRPAPPAPATEEGEAERPDTVGLRPLVVCDDLALPLGSVRLRARGSSGGQNGLASVIAELGCEDFPRLRLGIAPLAGEVDPAAWPDFVLAPFASAEREAARQMVEHAADAMAAWLADGFENAVSRFNRRVRRPAPGD